MDQKSKKLLKIEFIGKNVKVIDKNIQGKIIDETKNMFTIQTKNHNEEQKSSSGLFLKKTKKGIKKIIKKNNTIMLKINNQEEVTIDGKMLVGRPEERIKARIKG